MTVRLELPFIERVEQETTKVDIKAGVLKALMAIVWFLAMIPFVLGWLAGGLVKIVIYCVAAIRLGYRKGRGS